MDKYGADLPYLQNVRVPDMPMIFSARDVVPEYVSVEHFMVNATNYYYYYFQNLNAFYFCIF